MKKVILLLLLGVSFNGTSQILFSEDFDGIPGPTAGGPGTYSFPSGWMKINVDNRTPDAAVSYINEAWERREDFQNNVVDSVMFSTSWYAPVGAADDWTWTPAITLAPNARLKWNAKSMDPAYLEAYEVRIMTAPTVPTGSTGNIGNMVTSSTTVFSTGAESGAWTAHDISLAAFAGQTVYIAFRNISNDKFVLLIDDIIVQVVAENDLQVTVAGNVSQYTVLPAEQAAGQITMGATIQNSGVQLANNVALKCNVYLNGILDETLTSAAIPSLASGASSPFTLSGWLPAQNGTYTFKYFPSMTETDLVTSNDTLDAPFPLVIDPLTMARDIGPVTGSLGIGAGNGGYLGNSFTFAQPVYLDSISTLVNQGYLTEKYAAVIWATDGLGDPTTILYATDTLIYQTTDAQTLKMGFANGPLLVPAGTYVITQIEFDSTLAIALTNSIFTPGKTFVDWPTSPVPGWANNEDFVASFHKSDVIRPVFNVCQNVTYVTDTVLTNAGCDLSNGSAVLTPAPDYSIEWEDGTLSSTNSTLAQGYHTYTASNAYCSFTDSVLIMNPESPEVALDSLRNALCNGDEGFIALEITNGTAPFDVVWSNGMLNDTIMPGAGIYSAVITDASNCQVSISGIEITEPTALSGSSDVTDETCLNCEDGAIELTITGGTPPYAVSWNNGEATLSLEDLEPGTYSATITDANGCTFISSATVAEYDDLSVAELKDYGITVYPNPVATVLTISNNSGSAVRAVMLDASGRKVKDISVESSVNQLDISALSEGVYTLTFTTNEKVVSTKIIKL